LGILKRVVVIVDGGMNVWAAYIMIFLQLASVMVLKYQL